MEDDCLTIPAGASEAAKASLAGSWFFQGFASRRKDPYERESANRRLGLGCLQQKVAVAKANSERPVERGWRLIGSLDQAAFRYFVTNHCVCVVKETVWSYVAWCPIRRVVPHFRGTPLWCRLASFPKH